MAFCTTCGAEKPESGICPVCNPDTAETTPATPSPVEEQKRQETPPPVQPIQQPPPQYEQPQQTPQQTPQQHYQQQQFQQPPFTQQPQAQQSPIITDAISTVTKFISADPTEATRFAISSKVHSWAIVAGLSVLVSALATMLIPGGVIAMFANSMMRAMSGIFGGAVPRVSVGEVNADLPLGAFFGYGLLAAIISFFLWSCAMKAVYHFTKVNIPFPTVMNLVAASALPSTVAAATAIILCFFFAQASLLLLLVGGVANVILLYVGFNQSVQFQKNPFWFFIGAYAVCSIVMYFVIQWILGMIMDFNIADLLGGFDRMF